MCALKHRVIYRDNIQGITKPAIQRMSKQAGVKRMSMLVYEEIRGIIKLELENILRNAIVHVEHDRRNTLKTADVENALKSVKLNPAFAEGYPTCRSNIHSKYKKDPDAKPHRWKSGTESLRQIRRAQKTTCLHMAKLPFSRFVREVAQDFMTNLRISKNAFILLQVSIEKCIVDLLTDANLIAIRARRQTLFPEDIQLARRLKN